MNDREFERLLNEVLEGTATPDEARRVDEYAARNEAARTRRRELETTFQVLRRVPLEDPPAELRAEILSAIRSRAAHPEGRVGVLDALRAALPRSPFVGYAYSLVAGTALGVLVVLSLGRGSMSRDSQVAGALMPLGDTGRVVAQRSLALDDASVALESRIDGGDLWVEARMSGSREAEIDVDYGGAMLELREFRWSKPGAVTFDPGGIRLRQTGDAIVQARFAGGAAAGEAGIRVTLHAGNGSRAGVLQITSKPAVP